MSPTPEKLAWERGVVSGFTAGCVLSLCAWVVFTHNWTSIAKCEPDAVPEIEYHADSAKDVPGLSQRMREAGWDNLTAQAGYNGGYDVYGRCHATSIPWRRS